jgi:polysaccharide chain length determinant protein (PEP-CTERM system associated)
MTRDLFFYWRLLVRRLPVMTVLVLICSGLGVITAMKLPETWSTSARLLLEEPQIPDNMVTTAQQTDATEQLDIIQQKLLTRATLIDIANQYRVFADMDRMDPDEVFRQMRDATQIRRSAGRNRATIMSISFDARSGRVAANVVNELVTIVLAENSSSRRARVQNTLGFFEQEVDRLGQQLDTQSAEIAQFKSDNVGALPSDQRYRSDRLTLLQERLAQIDRDQRAIEVRREEVIQIYENTGQVEQIETRALSPQEQRLEAVRNQLESARGVYSETHPEVVRLNAVIDRLEAEISARPPPSDSGVEDDTPSEALSAQDLMFESTMADLDARMELLKADAIRVQEEIEALRDANARSAANEIALAALDRDFENTKRRYNIALNNLNTAQVSERIESAAQGQRITVIENASVPTSPTGPNRPLIATAGAMLGLSLAAAYFVLLELLNRSIRRPEELIQKFNVVPIGVVPYMESRRRRYIRRGLRVAVVVLIAIAVPTGLWYVDTNYLPLDLVVQRGLARLGLG